MAADGTTLLAIDVGTGSGRAALVGADGQIATLAAREYPVTVPQPGWSEQAPADWWRAVCEASREALSDAAAPPAAVAVCGQMHGPVPVDRAGRALSERVQLWNDKRPEPICAEFRERHDAMALLPRTGNLPAPSWIGFKVAWIARHQPEVYEGARAFLVPKDYVNLRLTGELATDFSEASGSYLLDVGTAAYAPELAALLGIDLERFAPVHASDAVIGEVTATAAEETGIPAGTPVVAGGGDMLVSLLGSGIVRPGIGSDITGTSNLISVFADAPLIDPAIQNLHAAGEGWIPFTILDAGGGALRWARRAFAPEAAYDAIDAAAKAAGVGAEGLLFLPYLSGERLGGAVNGRAQFFGLTERHELDHVWRAVLEGVALASRRNIAAMRAAGASFDRVVATGGGANSALWLKIKAAAYGLPIVTPRETESGLVGCAILAGCGAGLFDDPASAADALIGFSAPVEPDAAWAERYARLATIFDALHDEALGHFDALDAALK